MLKEHHLRAMESRLLRLTPGQWSADLGMPGEVIARTVNDQGEDVHTDVCHAARDEDAVWIALARRDMVMLLAEVRRLRKLLADGQ